MARGLKGHKKTTKKRRYNREKQPRGGGEGREVRNGERRGMGGEEASAATDTGHRAGHEEFPGNSDKGRSGLTEVARGSGDRVEHRIAAV